MRSRPLRPARPPWRSRGAWLALAFVLGTTGGVVATNPRWHTCVGLTWRQPETWRNGDGDCIGVTDGGTELAPAFDHALGGRFKALLEAIHAENDRIAHGVTACRDGGADDTVEVAALAPWRHDLTGGRAFHELEGMYVAQWQASNLRDPGDADSPGHAGRSGDGSRLRQVPHPDRRPPRRHVAVRLSGDGVRAAGAATILTGVLDQPGLYGVLAEIEALGLDLLEVRRLG